MSTTKLRDAMRQTVAAFQEVLAEDLIDYEFLEGELEHERRAKEAAIREAQCWAQEARTAASIVRECYRLAGAGGLASYHGAEPVRKMRKVLVGALAEVNARGVMLMPEFLEDLGITRAELRAVKARAS